MADADKTAQSENAEQQTTAPKIRGRSLWADARRRLTRDKAAMICFGVIVLYAIVAVGGYIYTGIAESDTGDSIPTFAEMDDPKNTNKPPSFDSWRHWLGTDWYGKPVVIKTLLGAKVSMSVGFVVNAIAVPLGMILGAIAGYYGRWLDDIVVWLYTTLSSIPGIILLIAMKFAFTQAGTVWGINLAGMAGLYIALGVISWIGTCRLVRAEVMKIRELDYVIAARATGRHSFVILLRHVMPNVMYLGIINFSLGFIGTIKAEVILSYLGLGVPAEMPSWGNMINAARQDLFQGRWWELTSAVTAMFIIVLALNIFGDRLRDALDPRLRNV
ncbi:MAG: ABC transporter permease [Planctomycetota bacterium]|jgi:peptide/nickel transport system permease protein